MSKLTRKFLLSLSAVLVSVVFLSLFLNANFIQRYLLHQEKQDMNRICDSLLSGGGLKEASIKEIENTEDVVIAWVEGSEENELLNERLREAFLNKGISLKKYWLWEQDRQDVMRDGRKIRIYNQDKLHYSLLVEYLSWEESFVAVAKIIPSMERTIPLVNQVTIIIFSGAILIMILLIFMLVRRITSPLKAIGETAKAISKLDFKTVEVHTGDELETLADDINHMSMKLKETHEALEQKNEQMEEMLANVSHDLKTPVALIKAYTSGIKDGMDDGTFLDTVIVQNERMEQMIERLLDLARMQRRKAVTESVDVSACLNGLVKEFEIQAESRGLDFDCRIADGLIVETDGEAVRVIFSNLLSNSVKYTDEGTMMATLDHCEGGILFQLKNHVADAKKIDPDRLWEPFYVAEESRNKDMSGTGLGLSIVKAAADECGIYCGCTLSGNTITFCVKFR